LEAGGALPMRGVLPWNQAEMPVYPGIYVSVGRGERQSRRQAGV